MDQFSINHNYTNNNNNSYLPPPNTDYYNTFLDIKFVYCPSCYYKATIKNTKTNHKMLRCDLCRLLIFANSTTSEQYLLQLIPYQENN